MEFNGPRIFTFKVQKERNEDEDEDEDEKYVNEKNILNIEDTNMHKIQKC